uniref:methyl-accepting chemotaxis protein n=1 Tax=Ideonella azotifigens TaxID=513160 RepID=UPI001F45175B
MLSFLSAKQRALLVLGFIAAGQACVATGLSLGWTTTAVLASSLTLNAVAAAIYVGSLMVIRQFNVHFCGLVRNLSKGDLSQEIRPVNANPETAVLLGLLSELQAELRRSITSIRTGADGVTVAASEIATGNQDLSSRTEQTASSLQQAANSISELTGTVRQSADAAAQANQLASSAAEVARRGGDVVSQVVSTMGEISTSSKKIADIIGVIDGIAFQTNILALNAAVEV